VPKGNFLIKVGMNGWLYLNIHRLGSWVGPTADLDKTAQRKVFAAAAGIYTQLSSL
jgi:hypothetical protein